MSNACVVLASGSGERFGASLPKQFINLSGIPVLVRTINSIKKSSNIDIIILVCSFAWIDYVKDLLLLHSINGVEVIEGGNSRLESTKKALLYLRDFKIEKVLIHDGVRPFVTSNIINSCLSALSYYSAVDTVIPSSDTIVEISGNIISNIPNREFLRRGQTPQGFIYTKILSAFDIAADNLSGYTDDCGLFKKIFPNEPIAIVDGHIDNFKITYESDLIFANAYLQKEGLASSVNNEDIDLNGKNVIVIGGTSGIGKELVKLCKSKGANVLSYGKSNGFDVTNFDDARFVLGNEITKWNKIDFFIYSAGVLEKRNFLDTSVDVVSHIINVNYLGFISLLKIIQPMLAASRGMILVFASSSYAKGRSGIAAYGASKAAVVNFVQAISEEPDFKNIRINCICPERTNTQMRKNAFGDEPEGSLLEPSVVAQKTIKYMGSDLTGQVLYIGVGK